MGLKLEFLDSICARSCVLCEDDTHGETAQTKMEIAAMH